MRNIKDIFKVILVLQLISFCVAHYGNSDAEFIDFGSSSQPSRDQQLIEAAIKRGMDGEAVAELLRTKKPVVKTTTTHDGFTKTTTYKLEDDGSISSKSVLTKRNRYVYNSGNIPDSIPIDELRNSPTGTVTRTFTDSDGSKVTQTIVASKPKPVTSMEPEGIHNDWFNKPFPSWTPQEKPHRTGHRTVTRTFTGPNGERRTVESWSSEPEVPRTATNTRTSTRTFVSHSGPTDFNNKPKYPPIGDINWPSMSSYEPSWEGLFPEDTNGWEVVSDSKVETTTKKNFQSWTPRTWEWPDFPTPPTTTTTTTTPPTTAKAKVPTEPERRTPKPLPNLDDFLRSQYGGPRNREPTTTTMVTPTNTPKSFTSTTASSTTQEPKVIKIEDLPVMEVLQNGKPASETILKNLPPHLTPRTPAEPVLKIEHKHPIEEDIIMYTPKVETNVRSYSKTHIGPEKPTIKDLDPQMQEVLRKADINPDEITDIQGNTITKTRQEPDGRIITTTYKVNTVLPAVPEQQHKPANAIQNHYGIIGAMDSFIPFGSVLPLHNPIEKFLAKLDLTRFDITSRNGQYTKTIIDENGDVLTATFVLSSPKGIRSEVKPQVNPFK